MRLFRRNKTIVVGNDPVDDFMTRWMRNPKDPGLIEESADWQWVSAALAEDETRWVRVAVRYVDARSAKGYVLATDRRIFFAWGTETRAFPLEDFSYLGENPSGKSEILIHLRVPSARDGHMYVQVDIVDRAAFADFFPTLRMLAERATEVAAGVISPQGTKPTNQAVDGEAQSHLFAGVVEPSEACLAYCDLDRVGRDKINRDTVCLTDRRLLWHDGRLIRGFNLESVTVWKPEGASTGEFWLKATTEEEREAIVHVYLTTYRPSPDESPHRCEEFYKRLAAEVARVNPEQPVPEDEADWDEDDT